MIGCLKEMTTNVAAGREAVPTMSAAGAYMSSQLLGLALLGVGLIVPTAAG